MLRTVLVSLVLAGLTVTPLAEAAGKKERFPDERRDAAIARAFTWLDANLAALPDVQGTPTKPFTYATAGLDYLLRGKSRTGKDPLPAIRKHLLTYLSEVERRHDDPKALPPRHGMAMSGRLIQYTWPLGQAAVFFSESALRKQSRAESTRAAKRIVSVLEAAQDENGGWGHGRINPDADDSDLPFPELAGKKGGYPSTLLAASNTVVTGLGVVETALGPGVVSGLGRARDYYETARLGNGNFPYDPSQRSAGRDLTGVSRTGGALLALYWLGVPKADPGYAKSLAYLRERLKYASEGHGSPALNLAQTAFAMRALGDEEWSEFREMFFPRIAAHQAEDGAFGCICEGRVFGTTCEDSTLAAGFESLARTKRAYVTSLYLFVLLLDRAEPEILAKKPKPVPTTERTQTDRPK